MKSRHAEKPTAVLPFLNPYRHEFVRVAVAVPPVAVAEPAKNAVQVRAMLARGDAEGIALIVFPELGLSAYAIDDLLFQDAAARCGRARDRRTDRGQPGICAGVCGRARRCGGAAGSTTARW